MRISWFGMLFGMVFFLTGCHSSLASTYSKGEVENMLEARYLVDFQYVSQDKIQRRPEEIAYRFVVPERDNLEITATARLKTSGTNIPFTYYNMMEDNYFKTLVESKMGEIEKKELELGLLCDWADSRPDVEIYVEEFAQMEQVAQYYGYLCDILGMEPGTKPETEYGAQYTGLSVYYKDSSGYPLEEIEVGQVDGSVREGLEYEYINSVREGEIVDDTVTEEQLRLTPKRAITGIYYKDQPVGEDLIEKFYYNKEAAGYYCDLHLKYSSHDQDADRNDFELLLGQFAELSFGEPRFLKKDGIYDSMEQKITYERGDDRYEVTTEYSTNAERSFRSVVAVRVMKNGVLIGDYPISAGIGHLSLSTGEMEDILGVRITIDQENERIDLSD